MSRPSSAGSVSSQQRREEWQALRAQADKLIGRAATPQNILFENEATDLANFSTPPDPDNGSTVSAASSIASAPPSLPTPSVTSATPQRNLPSVPAMRYQQPKALRKNKSNPNSPNKTPTKPARATEEGLTIADIALLIRNAITGSIDPLVNRLNNIESSLQKSQNNFDSTVVNIQEQIRDIRSPPGQAPQTGEKYYTPPLSSAGADSPTSEWLDQRTLFTQDLRTRNISFHSPPVPNDPTEKLQENPTDGDPNKQPSHPTNQKSQAPPIQAFQANPMHQPKTAAGNTSAGTASNQYNFELNTMASRMQTSRAKELASMTTAQLQNLAYLNQIEPDPQYEYLRAHTKLRAEESLRATDSQAPSIDRQGLRRLETLLQFTVNWQKYELICTTQGTLAKPIQSCVPIYVANRFFDEVITANFIQQTAPTPGKTISETLRIHAKSTAASAPRTARLTADATTLDFFRFLYREHVQPAQYEFIQPLMLIETMARSSPFRRNEYVKAIQVYSANFRMKILQCANLVNLLPATTETLFAHDTPNAATRHLTVAVTMDLYFHGIYPPATTYHLLRDATIRSIYDCHFSHEMDIPTFDSIATATQQAAYNLSSLLSSADSFFPRQQPQEEPFLPYESALNSSKKVPPTETEENRQYFSMLKRIRDIYRRLSQLSDNCSEDLLRSIRRTKEILAHCDVKFTRTEARDHSSRERTRTPERSRSTDHQSPSRSPANPRSRDHSHSPSAFPQHGQRPTDYSERQRTFQQSSNYRNDRGRSSFQRDEHRSRSKSRSASPTRQSSRSHSPSPDAAKPIPDGSATKYTDPRHNTTRTQTISSTRSLKIDQRRNLKPCRDHATIRYILQSSRLLGPSV